MIDADPTAAKNGAKHIWQHPYFWNPWLGQYSMLGFSPRGFLHLKNLDLESANLSNLWLPGSTKNEDKVSPRRWFCLGIFSNTTVEVPEAGAAREGEREENCGWNAFHPGQHPKRACGPRRLLAYMEDTWRHCGISNTWSMPLLGKNIGAQISDFGWLPSKWAIKRRKGWKNPLQLSQEISIKIKMTQNHWVVLVPFPSNSHCSHSRRRFCLRSGFDAWFVPRSIVTKKKSLPAFFHQPSGFWDKKGVVLNF